MTTLLRYDAARQALAEARSYDEVRDWEDKAAAVREYGRRSKNREMEIIALDIRAFAQRRQGEMLAEMKVAGILVEGRKKLSSATDSLTRLTLADLNTTLNESSVAQRLAAIPMDSFERLAARCRAHLEADPKAHSFDILREAEDTDKSAERERRRKLYESGGQVADLDRLAAEGFRAGVILADPPWRFRTWNETNDAKSARRHYDLMELPDICRMPVASLAADDCALFIWATWPTIFQTEEVIKSWGFKYSGLAWEWFKEHPSGKPTFGTGYGTRKNLEPCLLAIRGSPELISRSERDWLVAPRREHSVKPDEQYTPIEAMYGGPYLELFARRERPGWMVWGNQVAPPTIDGEKFDPDTGEIAQPEEEGEHEVAPDQTAREQAEAGEPSASGDDPASDPFELLNFDKPGFESDARRASPLGSMPKRAEDEDDLLPALPAFLRHDSPERKALPEKRGC